MTETPAGQPAVTQSNVATPTNSTTSETVAAPAQPTVTPENNAQPSGEAQPNAGAQTTLSEASQKYLQSQNIDLTKFGVDATNQASVDAFIAGHKAFRNSNNKANQKSDEQATPEMFAPQATTQAQPSQETQPQQQPQQPQQPAAQQVRTPSEIDIITMKNYLESQFKDTPADKLGTKEFYDSMRDFGLSPVKADGDWDVTAITKYAGIVANNERLAKLESEAKARPTSTIPSTNDKVYSIDTTAQTVSTMTEQAAQNIIIASNRAMKLGQGVHPQYEQAIQFMQHATLNK